MNAEKKGKFSQLAKRLKSMTEDQKMDFIAARSVLNVEGRSLSMNNAVLLLLQADETTPTVVGGYRQWQRAGRQVQKGEHGLMLWYPSKRKNDDDSEEPVRFYVGTVFDISQTQERV